MSHHHHHHNSNSDNLKLAFFINFAFSIFELIGGLWTNSTAILADAIHDFGDSLALAQAWYFEKVSKKKSNFTYTYGYDRFKLLGALISSLTLVISSIYVFIEAIPRLINPQYSNAKGMVVLALVGVSVNGFAMYRLMKSEGKNNINLKVVTIHLLEDVLGWVAILIGAVVMIFVEIPILDPILAIIIALYISYNVYKQLKAIIPIFLQSAPKEINLKIIQTKIKNLVLVDSIHNIHLWSQDGEKTVLTAHVVCCKIPNSSEYISLKKNLKKIIQENGITHSTIEVEWPKEKCRMPY